MKKIAVCLELQTAIREGDFFLAMVAKMIYKNKQRWPPVGHLTE